MSNKGFSLFESLLVLCLTSFLILLTTTQLPKLSSLDTEVQRIKEFMIQTQLQAILKREIVEFQFRKDAFCTNEECYSYNQGITSDAFSMKYYENGTINQAKTICFYKLHNTKCMYIQLGSGQIDIR